MRRNSIVTRLAIWIGLSLVIASVVLFFAARSFLANELAKRDREIIMQEIQEYSGTLQEGGAEAVDARYEEESRVAEPLGIYLRIISADGKTELEEAHDSFANYDLERLYRETGKSSDGWYRIKRLDGEKSVLDVTEISSPQGLTLQLGMNSKFRDELLERFTAIFLQFAGIALIISCAIGIVVARAGLKPLLKFRDSISNIKESDDIALNWKEVESSTYLEIEELSLAFNSLRKRVHRLITSMRDGLDMVAHETKSPLTRLKMKLEHSLLSGSEVDKNESLADALEETDRITKIIDIVLQVAESNGEFVNNSLTTFPGSEVLKKVFSLYEDTAIQKGCNLQIDQLKNDPAVTADFIRIVQAVSNLIDNAIKFTPSGGLVRLSISERDRFISFDVTDTGQGIPDDEKSLIWERLYRGSDSKRVAGLGLGLPLVLAVARSHGGGVEMESILGKGSTFHFYLPKS